MILKFWERFFVLWEERNAVVHGADSSERTKCRKVRLLRDLHTLHSLRSEVLPGDLIFFIAPTPADDAKIDLFVQSHGPAFIQNWINICRPLFLQSQRDAIRASTRGSRPITHYFKAIRETVSRISFQALETLRHRVTGARPRRPPTKRKKPPDPPRGPLLPSFFTR
jgi:hypothetical protein